MAEELVASCVVLETRRHGPEMCLGILLTSYPPQGGGPAITNWSWADVSDYESYGGTTWGDYVVIGTYAEGAFTMTRPPVPVTPQTIEETPEPEWGEYLGTPCPAPPGGWKVIDPELTTDESLELTIEVAESLPGFADVWVDELSSDTDLDEDEAGPEDMGNPEHLVLNVAVTDDPEATEATLRTTWGGALCVSRARHTSRELERILRDLVDRPDVLIASCGRDRVDVHVIHDDGSLQRAFDESYPPGLVRITSALKPYVPA